MFFFRVWNNQTNPAKDVDEAFKLTATEGIHSLLCRARKGVNSVMQHLAWIALGKFDLIDFFYNIH
jgi:hypothetical protein